MLKPVELKNWFKKRWKSRPNALSKDQKLLWGKSSVLKANSGGCDCGAIDCRSSPFLLKIFGDFRWKYFAYLKSRISLLLRTIFLFVWLNFSFRSETSLPSLRCFFRVRTSIGRISIKICSVHSSDSKPLNSGLIALRKQTKWEVFSGKCWMSFTYSAILANSWSLISTRTSMAAYRSMSRDSGLRDQNFWSRR